MRYIIIALGLIITSCNNIPNKRLEDIENRLNALEYQGANTLFTIDLLLNQRDYTESMLDDIQKDIIHLSYSIGDTLNELATLRQQVYINGEAIISGGVSIIDPCPSVYSHHPKEYVIKIGDKYLAYFQDTSGYRFITVLQDNVEYRTTDKRNCIFHL